MAVMAFANELLMFTVFLLAVNKSCSTCTTISTDRFHVQNGVKNRVLKGRVFKTTNIEEHDAECFFECIKNCRCLSFNVCDKQCQLNVDTKEMRDMHLKGKNSLTIQDGCRYYNLGNTSTFSQCCSISNPCLHGGTCISHPQRKDNINHRFSCECPRGYYGDICQTQTPKTCSDYMAHLAKPLSGVHTVFDANGNYSVYCDFDSEPNFGWTMVMSYSRNNADTVQDNNFNDAGLLADVPVNENSFNWLAFRLSLARMNGVREKSSHWRATCAFDEYAVDYDEYIRVNLSVVDFSSYYSGDSASPSDCQTVEYVKIRESECNNCNISLRYWEFTPPFLSPMTSPSSNCPYKLPQNIIALCGNDWSYFFLISFDKCFDLKSKCQRNGTSTTQNWFGTGPVEEN